MIHPTIEVNECLFIEMDKGCLEEEEKVNFSDISEPFLVINYFEDWL